MSMYRYARNLNVNIYIRELLGYRPILDSAKSLADSKIDLSDDPAFTKLPQLTRIPLESIVFENNGAKWQ